MYNPDIHQRRSIRLKGYDYAQCGAYFVTICTQNRECLFGDIVGGKMQMNDAGKMVEKWYAEIARKYVDIHTHEYIVMPNHFHAIIVNVSPAYVGADLRVCPSDDEGASTEHVQGEHIGSPLHCVVRWFKTMTTNEYIRHVKNNGWKPFDKRIWQRNYHEHIIRDDDDYASIAAYINNNPMNWEKDTLWNT